MVGMSTRLSIINTSARTGKLSAYTMVKYSWHNVLRTIIGMNFIMRLFY
ncbi:MAG: hypothetical protein P8Q55_05565 [Candidatus Poseidoniaceae archaeon]|nr:hypothetical protein [Candidatus Poseidoniaceae archaeon]